LTTEVRKCEQLAQGCYVAVRDREPILRCLNGKFDAITSIKRHLRNSKYL